MSVCAAQTPVPVRPVASPDDYDYVFRKYRSFLYGVVYNSGVPSYLVEDACHEILIRMMSQDGLAKFIGSVADNPRRIKAYLASYFSLGARAELSRIRAHAQRTVALEAVGDIEYPVTEEDSPESPLRDDLLASTEGDVRYFIEHPASQHATYAKVRQALVEAGWDALRIRRTVKQARAVTKKHLCAAAAAAL